MVLCNVCEKLGSYHLLRSRLDIKTSSIKYFHQRFIEPDLDSHHANRNNFIYELHRARGLKFSDDRDRVFAWLGHFSLCKSSQMLQALRADYRSSTTQVYIDVARRALMADTEKIDGSALITLAAVQHLSPQSHHDARTEGHQGIQRRIEDKLPSWVPDWRISRSFILSEPISPHRAHRSSLPELEFIDGGLTLRITGLEFDSIEACSRPFSSKEFHIVYPPEARSTIEYIWHDICKKDHFSYDNKYANGQESLFACMHTLSNGCVQVTGREKRTYHAVPRSRWLKQQASYLVKTLGRSEVVGLDVRDLADETQSEEDQWSRAASAASKNRSFARSSKDYYILGPEIMEVGDVICVLLGGKIPFCLRPRGNHYFLVGECYVHGLMDGEAVEMMNRRELSKRQFDIV